MQSRTTATFALVATACITSAAHAQSNEARATVNGRAVEAYVSENALQVQYIRDIDTDKLGALEGRAGVFYNDDDDLIVSGDLLGLIGGRDRQSREGLHFRAGTRLY
ncbi:MAG TPA: hypothetical protein VFO94_16180, partial [Gammaproteobacteria bacterium]|nr:hypothetical protein [Gammaproteobacteria bacterium]